MNVPLIYITEKMEKQKELHFIPMDKFFTQEHSTMLATSAEKPAKVFATMQSLRC